ncbi:MAG: methionine synthase, partial [Thermotoga sp.]
MKILGASIGSDVHVVGLLNFLDIAKREGYDVVYLGGAIPVDRLVREMEKNQPDIVAISYRLGSEPLKKLLDELRREVREKGLDKIEYVFGGTMETGEVARASGIFKKVFDGTEELEDVVMYLRKTMRASKEEMEFPQTLHERIEFKKPFPLIR